MTFRSRLPLLLPAVLLLIPVTLSAQEQPAALELSAPKADDAKKPVLPKIADEPKVIDPASLLPEPLAKPVTVDLSRSSLKEVVTWLEQEQKLTVIVEEAELAKANISLGDPVADVLQQSPVYLLLNRLSLIGVGWYERNGVLYITSRKAATAWERTLPYTVGDLRDDGYELYGLQEAINLALGYDAVDGDTSFVGDVLFLRANDVRHRTVAALLKSLEKPGRQTFVNDPVAHQVIRDQLEKPISVEFDEAPFVETLREVGRLAGVDLRLGTTSVRERQPVSLALRDLPVETVLETLVGKFGLTWMIRDGVLWVVTANTAEANRTAVVYDVRDLATDDYESDALSRTLSMHIGPEEDPDRGALRITFAKAGVMVVRADDRIHSEVLRLLQRYRSALKVSKPRNRDEEPDPNEVKTVYYRMQKPVADGLMQLLPQLVAPETWKQEGKDDAIGTIVQTASRTELEVAVTQTTELELPIPVIHSVLIVTQTRKVHEEIEEVIYRIEDGDNSVSAGGGLGGGGLGGGGGGNGFGGAFFSTKPQ